MKRVRSDNCCVTPQCQDNSAISVTAQQWLARQTARSCASDNRFYKQSCDEPSEISRIRGSTVYQLVTWSDSCYLCHGFPQTWYSSVYSCRAVYVECWDCVRFGGCLCLLLQGFIYAKLITVSETISVPINTGLNSVSINSFGDYFCLHLQRCLCFEPHTTIMISLCVPSIRI
jgi:hypothetical protein